MCLITYSWYRFRPVYTKNEKVFYTIYTFYYLQKEKEGVGAGGEEAGLQHGHYHQTPNHRKHDGGRERRSE